MTTQTALQQLEQVLINGDLATLDAGNRVMYYNKVCESSGLNPLTRPFEYIRLNGKLTLYARKDATDQLRKIHEVSIQITARDKTDDLYIVTARATDKSGRCDESIGAVPIAGLKGEALANACMKAETKAKRRVTLSVAGLGLLDENEVASIPAGSAQHVVVDKETGEIIEQKKIEAVPTGHDEAVQVIINPLFNMHTLNDRLAACEYWSDLSKEVKTAAWPKISKPIQDWLREAINNGPNGAAKP